MYTNKEGLWNRLVPSSEKKGYKGNKIVWMGAFNCLEEFSSVNWHLNVVIASVFNELDIKLRWNWSQILNGCTVPASLDAWAELK
jgi:hypothetical protein